MKARASFLGERISCSRELRWHLNNRKCVPKQKHTYNPTKLTILSSRTTLVEPSLRLHLVPSTERKESLTFHVPVTFIHVLGTSSWDTFLCLLSSVTFWWQGLHLYSVLQAWSFYFKTISVPFDLLHPNWEMKHESLLLCLQEGLLLELKTACLSSFVLDASSTLAHLRAFTIFLTVWIPFGSLVWVTKYIWCSNSWDSWEDTDFLPASPSISVFSLCLIYCPLSSRYIEVEKRLNCCLPFSTVNSLRLSELFPWMLQGEPPG